MKASQAKLGKLYKAVKVPSWEYLTEGEIYLCDSDRKGAIGLHIPNGGPGTYLFNSQAEAVELQEVV